MGKKSKTKAEAADTSKGSVSKSAALCIEMGLNDVDLEYTDADYQNLTTYTLFSRMVRPQLAAANPKITANKMNSLLEAKFQEFRESNPLTKARSDRLERLERIMKAGKSFAADSDSDVKKKPKVAPKVVESESDSGEDDKKDGSESDVSEEPKRLSDSQEIDALAKKPDSASDESDEAMKQDESEDSDVSPTKKRVKMVSDEDSGEEQVEEEDEQAASDEEDKEETEQDSYEGSDNNEDEGKSRMVTKITPLRIKLASLGPRRSGRERRAPKKIMSDREFSHLLDSDGRGSSMEEKSRKRQRKKADSEDDFELSSDDDDERPKRKRRGRKKKKVPTATLR